MSLFQAHDVRSKYKSSNDIAGTTGLFKCTIYFKVKNVCFIFVLAYVLFVWKVLETYTVQHYTASCIS